MFSTGAGWGLLFTTFIFGAIGFIYTSVAWPLGRRRGTRTLIVASVVATLVVATLVVGNMAVRSALNGGELLAGPLLRFWVFMLLPIGVGFAFSTMSIHRSLAAYGGARPTAVATLLAIGAFFAGGALVLIGVLLFDIGRFFAS